MDFQSLSDLSFLGFVVAILTPSALFFLLKKTFWPRPKVDMLHKKYILITGCDSGFGRSTAIRLDELGFNVFATCLTNEGKESLEALCSPRFKAFIVNVTDSKQIQSCYREIVHDWLPANQGIVSLINEAPYCITKYGVEAFSDALRREMAQWDVKVCIMVPQGFKTSIWTEVAGEKLTGLWNGISDEMRKDYGVGYLERYREFLKNLMASTSTNLDMVVNGVVDAVTSVHPSYRYVVGMQAKKIALLSIMPTAIQDLWFKAVVNKD
ncbi:hypothetical protein QZH41_019488 [Actinostola sp. cb2023]|nr:hypothetical protein QZH41_019488 [Actinostola sp. cb2023]